MRELDFDAVVGRLQLWRDSLLERLKDPASNPEALRIKLQVDDAIDCLRLCERHRIMPDARVVKLPNPRTSTPSSEFRIIEDQESDQREGWIEVEVDGVPIRPLPGSLLIESR